MAPGGAARLLARADQAAARAGRPGPGRGLPPQSSEEARLHAADVRAEGEPAQGRGQPARCREAAGDGAEVAAGRSSKPSSNTTRASSGSRIWPPAMSLAPSTCSPGSSTPWRLTCGSRRRPALGPSVAAPAARTTAPAAARVDRDEVLDERRGRRGPRPKPELRPRPRPARTPRPRRAAVDETPSNR